MFDSEKSIANWRRQMLAVGIKTPVPLEELENHLREEIERQIKLGMGKRQAFETAAQQIGEAKQIKIEFRKAGADNWNGPLAWTTWGLFAISFFLPACGDLWGWQCAGLSATSVSWPNFSTNLGSIYFASLTFANLLMIASPFLLWHFSRKVDSLKWLGCSSLVAMALVWSYVLLAATHGSAKDLKIGCYIWAFSFLPLCLSTFKIHGRLTRAAKYV
jgi:hypothetical protein